MRFYEFFAGGGMARLGLGPAWRCSFANDIDAAKARSYKACFGKAEELRVRDLAEITPHDLPGVADLAWASFPCQDLSLAGYGKGLSGGRSGLFWTFWRLMESLHSQGRAPRMIVLENVYGAITSHGGRDLAAICAAMCSQGYRIAPLVIDAQMFLPQSRPRLFIVGVGPEAEPPVHILAQGPVGPWHPEALGPAFDLLAPETRKAWLWLNPPLPPQRLTRLADLVEEHPEGVRWHTPFETQRLVDMMSPINRKKLDQAMAAGHCLVGTVYKRTRTDAAGNRRQRAEVRFDDIAGCLRTPAGGSSRQTVLVVEGRHVRSRLLSPREAARLMGLPEDYPLPARYNDAYRLAGDGVAVPAVSWLTRHVLEPSLARAERRKVAA